MCDMQKMPTREDASCDEDDEMNFATFSNVGGAGTHFMTTGGQLPVTKIQQANGNTLSQVVGMVGGVGVGTSEGMQYSTMPQLISVPITLPGHKPGEPQPTVQIQVLNPSLLQAQQQPKYQMQIPIQGFTQGGAVLTLAYSPETSEAGGIQIVGQNTLTESGLQVLTSLPPEMQFIQQAPQNDEKQQTNPNIHQVIVTPNQQIIINNPVNSKPINNNTTNNNNNTEIVIKEECDDSMDAESTQGTETIENPSWSFNSNQEDLVKYLNSLQPQQAQALPLSLQQFLKMNTNTRSITPTSIHKLDLSEEVEVEEKINDEPVAEAIIGEDGTLRIHTKKKKKYKKKPPKPARPKPGQVVIATAADGTAIFCCPECQMAYPEKEQLEVHLLTHKIERRFICGICGAGLKRKEHLERHKLGHNPDRPFVCGVCRKGFKRREHLNLHTVMHSGVKTEMCNECGKGFYRKDHLRKHTRSHENKRLRDEANDTSSVMDKSATNTTTNTNFPILPEITIHVPTSANVQVPVQINIPQHVVSSLAAAQQQQDTQAQIEALLAQHS